MDAWTIQGLISGRITRPRIIGYVSEELARILGVRNREVWLSTESMEKQLREHPDLKVEDYLLMPAILNHGMAFADSKNHLSFVRQFEVPKPHMLKLVIKITFDHEELFAVSMHKIQPRHLARMTKRNQRIR